MHVHFVLRDCNEWPYDDNNEQCEGEIAFLHTQRLQSIACHTVEICDYVFFFVFIVVATLSTCVCPDAIVSQR